MTTEAQKQEVIAAISKVEHEELLKIRDLLAVADAQARGAAKPRAYPGFGGRPAGS